MKKIFCVFAMLAVFLFAGVCSAQDVWIDHVDFEGENFDLYVMNDAVEGRVLGDEKYIKVFTKRVSHGELQQIVCWVFDKVGSDSMWRYETSTMSGMHTTVVIPRNALFEYCMKKLNWSYTIRGEGILYYYF